MKLSWRQLMFVSLIIFWSFFYFFIPFTIAGVKVNINQAGQEELMTLSGIGSVKARAIIDYREANGFFESIEDLMKVNGIGQVTFEKIKDEISVAGDVSGGEVGFLSTREQADALVIINELLPDPEGSDEAEWIELKNKSGSEIDLSGWRLEDMAGKIYSFLAEQEKNKIKSAGFLVLTRGESGLVLNNEGDSLFLYNESGYLKSEVSYDNAKEGYSLARSEDDIYAWTKKITPGEENGTDFLDEVTGSPGQYSARAKSQFSGRVFLNEIMFNPNGVDGADNEWMEIFNYNGGSLNLRGWQITDNQGEVILGEKYIKQGNYFLLRRGETGIILNNEGGEKIILSDAKGDLVDEVILKKDAREGESYNRCDREKEMLWLKVSTPSVANACPVKNENPKAYFELEDRDGAPGEYLWIDASESFDPDGEIKIYKWIFDRPVEIMGERAQFFSFREAKAQFKIVESGEYEITLEVEDNLGAMDRYVQRSVWGEEESAIEDRCGELRISEIMIDPVIGDIDGEWIEIFYGGDKPEINLRGCQIDDSESGSKSYVFGDEIIKQNSYLVVRNADSGLAFNNKGDDARILRADGSLVSKISWVKSMKGMSYADFGPNGWRFTTEVSPGAENKMSESEVYYPNQDDIIPSTYPVLAIAETKEMDKGTRVSIEGKVTVEPGVLGKNIFYIDDGEQGLQIYCFRKDFPALAVGDAIVVRGEMSESAGEKRLKIKDSTDIIFLGSGEPLPPREAQTEDVGEYLEGSLIIVRGELTEVKAASIWLDDETGEVKIYLKRNASIPFDYESGDVLAVSGIVSEWNGEYRLLPRYSDDVKLLKSVRGNSIQGEQPAPLLENKENEGRFLKYILAVVGACLLIIIGLVVKNREARRIVSS